MPDCKKHAYALCENKIKMCCCSRTIWRGCGKQLCPDHIECHYTEEKVEMYHCRLSIQDIADDADIDDQESYRSECGSNYVLKKQYKSSKQKCIFTVLAIVLFVLLFVSVYLAGSGALD